MVAECVSHHHVSNTICHVSHCVTYLLTQDQAVQTTLGAVVTEASAGFTGPEEETELATEPSPAFVPQQEELLLGNTFTIFSCLWSHQLPSLFTQLPLVSC